MNVGEVVIAAIFSQSIIDLIIHFSPKIFVRIGDNAYQELSEVTDIVATHQMTAKAYFIVPHIQ